MSVQVIGSGTIGGIDEGLVVSGIVTATELDISGNIDVDGHTNLDHVSVSGATTCTGGAVFLNSISLNASTNNYLYFDDNLNFTRNGHGNEMTIDSSGRVLINTTTTYPSNQMLYVKGGSPSTVYDGQAYLEGSETSGAINTGGTLVFGGHDGGTARTWGAIRTLKEDGTSGNYGSYMAFLTRPNGSAPTEKLRIKSDGNVGMGGNTNPTNVLHIKTAVTNTAVATIESTATNSYPFLRLKNDAKEYQLTCHGGLSDAFTIYDGTSSAHRFTIASDGDVGIGTISPLERVHIHKNSATGPFMYITNTSTGVSASDGIQIGYDGTNTAVFKNNEPTDLVFYAGSQSFRITSSGHVLPDANNTQDLGSSSKRWRNVYTTDLQLSNKGKTNDVDNTWGDYTIQEGESDLFLINNRNGKKYKFNLTEVS